MPKANPREGTVAIRAIARGAPRGSSLTEEMRRRGERLGVRGWVREGEDGELLMHAEGDAAAVEELLELLREAPGADGVDTVETEPVELEGHEQFAIRGISAGRFVVHESRGGRGGFELQLEVGGERRSWAVPKGPSMSPADKRLAIELPGGPWREQGDQAGGGEADVWDEGSYEQGGRVPWPEALERGHAVFVLHGAKLEGGFALQRTGGGPRPRWLLIKRREKSPTPAAGTG